MAGVYWPEAGGSATYLRRLKSDLEARGHRVRVLCYGEEPSERDVVRVTRRLPVPVRVAVFTYWAARWLRECDVWFVNEYGLTATVLRPLLRKPSVMKIVGDWAWESGVNQGRVPMSPIGPDGVFRDPLLRLQAERQHPLVELRKTIRTYAASSMDRILVPSRYLARVVTSWGVPPDRITVIYNGIDPSVHEVRVTREPGLIVTVARLVAWKGIDHLIEAIGLLAQRGSRARLLVLGDGPDLRRLQAAASLIPGRITFAGHVDRGEVRRQLARASSFVLASAYEGLPHVVLEAMVEGCPVIVAGAGGTVEVVRSEVDGLVVPYGDPQALADALSRVLEDQDFAARLSSAGGRRVREAFSWRSTSDAAITLLEEVAARSA